MKSKSLLVLFSVITLLCLHEAYMQGVFNKNSPAEDNWITHAADNFAGGNGTREAPYQINNAEELARLAYIVNNNMRDIEGIKFAEKYYVLTADIDLGRREWTPIGIRVGYSEKISFSGHFNGNGYKVFMLKIIKIESNTPSDPVRSPGYKNSNDLNHNNKFGLFGFISGKSAEQPAVIENVELVKIDMDLPGRRYIGGLAGYVENCNVQNCKVSGSILIREYFLGAMLDTSLAGGLIGENKGTVTSCVTNIRIASRHIDALGNDSAIGGLIGVNHGLVKNSSTSSDIALSVGGSILDSYYGYAGGLIAVNKGTIENCKAYSSVKEGRNTKGDTLCVKNDGKVINSESDGFILPAISKILYYILHGGVFFIMILWPFLVFPNNLFLMLIILIWIVIRKISNRHT